MKKVIIDTNLWISFLLGHQVQFVRRMLTDLRFEVYVCARLIEEYATWPAVTDVISDHGDSHNPLSFFNLIFPSHQMAKGAEEFLRLLDDAQEYGHGFDVELAGLDVVNDALAIVGK